LKFLLISNILLFTSCNTTKEGINDSEVEYVEVNGKTMTREDSVFQLAKDLNIGYDPNSENINDVLDKILITKKSLIARLDSLDDRADKMESAAIQYKKKENRLI